MHAYRNFDLKGDEGDSSEVKSFKSICYSVEGERKDEKKAVM